ncbi:MAG: hypothetical protein LKI76_07565 [Megasphaera sp.]|uniref:hypothetical protein n=1 Tax=Megasphaera sueciensis TaxID=349094 RepID=UPI003CFF9418|nr:hypothetical protein [Megasphaera sp.]MCI1823769.1 hypothetical protein [Megasphaera sp.]
MNPTDALGCGTICTKHCCHRRSIVNQMLREIARELKLIAKKRQPSSNMPQQIINDLSVNNTYLRMENLQIGSYTLLIQTLLHRKKNSIDITVSARIWKIYVFYHPDQSATVGN